MQAADVGVDIPERMPDDVHQLLGAGLEGAVRPVIQRVVAGIADQETIETAPKVIDIKHEFRQQVRIFGELTGTGKQFFHLMNGHFGQVLDGFQQLRKFFSGNIPLVREHVQQPGLAAAQLGQNLLQNPAEQLAAQQFFRCFANPVL